MKTDLENIEPLDVEMLECFDHATGRTKQCAKSALVHLEKATRLVPIDSEMAVFRIFCAEEEAATSVFAAVKFRGYENSGKLNYRNHLQKQALFPFLMAIRNYLAGCKPPPPETRLVIRTVEGKKRLGISANFPEHGWGEPQPPLHFSIFGVEDGRRARFQHEVEQLAAGSGAADVQKWLKANANFRNKILYASDDGYPVVGSGVKDALEMGRRRVFALLRLSCLIFPHAQRAMFVQQALDAFLIMLGSLSEEDLQW